MPVHAQSVISSWVNDFDPVFYTALTNQENSAYTRGGTNTVANWQPKFTALNTAMTTWKNTNRQAILQEFISPLYSYKILSDIFGTSSSLITDGSVDALNIFSMNGFIAATKTRPEAYYDDIVIVVSPPSNTSAKMNSSVATVAGATAVESSTISGYTSTMTAVIQAKSFQLLFEDSVTSGSPPNKTGMADFIFNTLHYKHIYEILNVGSLTLPPSVS